MGNEIRIETDRLVLREFWLEDAGDLIAIADQEHVWRWLPDWYGFDRWAEEWIQKVRKNYIIDDPSKGFISLAIELKENKQLIGEVAIGKCDHGIEICYFMSLPNTNKGYVTEASAAIIDFAFQRYGFETLVATAQPQNFSSNKVLQKLGFEYDSVIQKLGNGQTDVLPFNFYQLRNPYKK